MLPPYIIDLLPPFLKNVPELILVGCLVMVCAAIGMGAWLFQKVRRLGLEVRRLGELLSRFANSGNLNREGLSLAKLEQIRTECRKLPESARGWWEALDSDIERYTSPEDIEGWFLTERPRQILSYEIVVGQNLNTSLFTSFPGLLTGTGLALTFVAILLALHGVHYDVKNAAEPITGIDSLINGLSGKFLSSIIALALSIVFTVFEKRRMRGLRKAYDRMITSVSAAIPYLSEERILLDIQRFAAKQTVSVSHISSEVVDRLIGTFNTDVVPVLTEGMASGVADKMQIEFRPMLHQMNETLEELKNATVRLESQKQESVSGEIRVLLKSLEESLVGALSQMGSDFHNALTGAATQEFGNVQNTLESTRQMLSDMNSQFGAMQAAFAAIVRRAEESTSDQMRIGREQTQALTALMNGLMIRMQESADQNLGAVRAQLGLVVSDLAEKVGALSQDMMAAADKVAKQAQVSANQVLEQTSKSSESTAERLEKLLANIEARSKDFQIASKALLASRDLVAEIVEGNKEALASMVEASRQVKAYSTGLAGQGDALKAINQLQSQVAGQLRETSGALRDSIGQNDKLLGEYRRAFEGYKNVIDGLDQSLAKVLKAIQAGMRDYNQSIENNFKEIVKISNPMISEASGLLQTQISELSGQLEELTSVISSSMERVNGRK